MDDATSVFERVAFRSFWDDGLLDLMVGLVILVVGLSWWQGIAVYGAVFPAVCASLWHPLRKRLVEPRMGYVEFSGDRELKARSFRHALVAFFAGTAMFGAALFIIFRGMATPGAASWIAGLPLLLIGIPLLFFAAFTSCWRFAVYAGIALLAGVDMVLQDLDPHVGLIASGTIILVSGIVMLARFLSRHPAEPQ